MLAPIAGCGLIVGIDQFKSTPTNCDPTKGCVTKDCPFVSEQDLLNACTDKNVECVQFDESRVKGPRLPDGGVAPVPGVDAAVSDGSAIEEAGTTTSCTAIPGAKGPTVFVQGTAKPYVAALARALFADAKNPITIVWRGMSSCYAWEQLLSGEPIDTEPGAGYGQYWTPNDTDMLNGNRCAFRVGAGGDAGDGAVSMAPVADITVADLFAQSCQPLPNGLPQNIGDFFGPVQTMLFVAPKASGERAISATAAYYVFGFGNQSGTAPWTDETFIFRLADESGTQRMIGAGIGVPSDKWKGTNLGNTGPLLAKLKTPTPGAESKTIGPLAYTNILESDRPSLEILAYKHYGQNQCAYFPDSTQNARDKKNVRDGHYALWGPIHFATRINSGGVPVNPNAQTVINMWTGATAPPGNLDLIQIAALNNLVPTCAMTVKRRSEMGPLEPVQPDNACGCWFEKQAGGNPNCQPCTKNADCPASAPKCSYNYCEAR